ncbi:hypothetical protein Dshi_2421 [Dinoroseobacter shibae DFL 12 = DSM 16493]|jgi:hypothetical protein|uniref:DUF2484 family protein n=1 Tax=Dinoroseobacter shibae (strain DSM 16493 / NCIMB 14021 / DFL 12) TaxID=398580 RepID=A8LS62_DINSH|nr:DUF2484 family protein [Dinoroseobacter shibae]ABV94155.1 hypothetical protein Dshi_2421 [Dinoroseobacter shibae DFL 12 = DSM 16493]URF45596.1 DUF2484 family protein [Dinoroseobacter shibae]URF49901.1 DUF2484 family protein [Dinoroseobacter shibae]
MPTTFPLSLTLFCVWILVAAVIAVLPSRYHWRGAFVLMALLVPLLGYIWAQLGPWYLLGAAVAAVSVLRWPVRYAMGWLRARLTGAGK